MAKPPQAQLLLRPRTLDPAPILPLILIEAAVPSPRTEGSRGTLVLRFRLRPHMDMDSFLVHTPLLVSSRMLPLGTDFLSIASVLFFFFLFVHTFVLRPLAFLAKIAFFFFFFWLLLCSVLGFFCFSSLSWHFHVLFCCLAAIFSLAHTPSVWSLLSSLHYFIAFSRHFYFALQVCIFSASLVH
jgi:hypothetical protein